MLAFKSELTTLDRRDCSQFPFSTTFANSGKNRHFKPTSIDLSTTENRQRREWVDIVK
jgi:hypothetical protein